MYTCDTLCHADAPCAPADPARRHGAASGPASGLLEFSPGGQLPTLANSRLAQRITALCNDACASLASGVTYDALWSAEHPTAASLAQAPESPCP